MKYQHTKKYEKKYFLFPFYLMMAILFGFTMGKWSASWDFLKREPEKGVSYREHNKHTREFSADREIKRKGNTITYRNFFSSDLTIRDLEELVHHSGSQEKKKSILIQSILYQLSATELEEALAVYEKLDRHSPRQWEFMNSLFYRWGELDPYGGIEEINRVLLEDKRLYAWRSLMQGWAKSDPDAAWNYAHLMEEREIKQACIQSILPVIGEKDPESMLNYIEENGVDSYKLVWDIFQSFSRVDPQKAAQRLLDSPDPLFQKTGLRSIIREWAIQDPREAMQWVDQLSDASLKKQGVERLLGELTYHDPKMALDYAASLPAQVVETLPLLEGRFIRNLARSVPQETFHWGMRSLSEKSKMPFFKTLFSEWGRRDPEKALQAAQEIVHQERKGQVYQILARSWGNKNFEEASNWVENLPDFMEKENALVGLVKAKQRKNPEEAIHWATKIQDKDMREGALVDVFSSWVILNRSKALQWIQDTELLPERVKEGYDKE